MACGASIRPVRSPGASVPASTDEPRHQIHIRASEDRGRDRQRTRARAPVAAQRRGHWDEVLGWSSCDRSPDTEAASRVIHYYLAAHASPRTHDTAHRPQAPSSGEVLGRLYDMGGRCESVLSARRAHRDELVRRARSASRALTSYVYRVYVW